MKYTPDMVACILKHIRQGKPYKHAAESAGINEETFYRWQKRHKDFAAQVQQANVEARDALYGVVAHDIASGNPTYAKWLLSIRWPDLYGNKIKAELSTDPEKPIEVQHKADPESIVAWRELQAGLRALGYIPDVSESETPPTAADSPATIVSELTG